MAALWFYRPVGVAGHVVATLMREQWADVAIAHAVTDVSVVSVSHPRKGVWCAPQSKARRPDDTIFLDIPDDFTTKWLAYRWGVRYHWFDIFIPPTTFPLDRAPTSVELVRQFILDADAHGYRNPSAAMLKNVRGVSATGLHRALSQPV